MSHHVQRPATTVARVVTPSNIDEALAALEQPRARPIAGGTDLLIELANGEHADVETLVDLTRLPGLDEITEADGIISIGALVTHNRVAADPICQRLGAPLVQACREVGSPQLRNRATVAGNLVTSSPANDSITALIALDAEVTVLSRRQTRRVSIAAFHCGFRQTTLEPDELVTAISFPALREPWRGVFVKLGLRSAQAISVVNLAVVARLEPGSLKVEEVRLAYGSVGATVVRATEAEELLRGFELNDELIEAAATEAAANVTPIDDVRATARYRSQVMVEMTRRALEAIRDDAGLIDADPVLLWGQTEGRWPTGEGWGGEHQRFSTVSATVNNETVSAPRGQGTLLDWLRDTGHTGVKEGCAEGECGSCTVHLDGMAVLSCLIPASRAEGTEITTVEGLRDLEDPTGALHPLQDAFVETGAVQCGYCIPGFLVAGAKLLEQCPQPDERQVVDGLAGNLCRCTGYYKIIDAFTSTGTGTGKGVAVEIGSETQR